MARLASADLKNSGVRRQSRPRNLGRPTRDAASELPDIILDAAQHLFLSQGFEATSLNQIAARAGVTKRTIYAKFGDKAEIFGDAVRRMLRQRRKSGDDLGATASVFDRLVHFGDIVLAVSLDSAILDLCRVAVAEARRFPRLAALIDEQMTNGPQVRLAMIMREEVANRRLTGGDPDQAARMLFIMIVGPAKFDALFAASIWSPKRQSEWVRSAIHAFLKGAERR